MLKALNRQRSASWEERFTRATVVKNRARKIRARMRAARHAKIGPNCISWVNHPSAPANFVILSQISKGLISALLVLSIVPGNVPAQQKDKVPTIQTPAHFRGVDPNVSPDQHSIGDLKWFEVFKDPELQKLVRTAMVNDVSAIEPDHPYSFFGSQMQGWISGTTNLTPWQPVRVYAPPSRETASAKAEAASK